MAEAVGVEKGERVEARLGYYPRSLTRRVGKLELRVPQDCQGRQLSRGSDLTYEIAAWRYAY
jgi:transposase-like protein